MKYLLYPFAAVISFLLAVFAVLFFNWWVVLFRDEKGNLPRGLKYFQTFDAVIPAGYIAGLTWLNRNPAYGFDYYPLGIEWNPDNWTVRYFHNSTSSFFLATGDGAFNLEYSCSWCQLKFGWKAWNNFTDGKFGRVFGDGTRIPVCITIKGKAS